jgi:signal transduction histidine kinase
MRSQVAEMTEDELGPSLDVPRTKDEIAALATTMNDLLGRVRGARRRERRFVAEAGHELRTPLAILQGELELADRPGRSEDELREALRVAHDESLRLGRLAEELLVLARTDAGAMELHRRPTDLCALVERSVTALGPQADQRDVSVQLACAVGEPVDLDPDRFRQAVDNLLVNALHHAPGGTTIDVVVERRGPELACIVRDEGPGFPPDFLDQAFDRFAKPPSQAGGGAGLGLSIVRSIASAHAGRAWVANRPGTGAEAGLTVGGAHLTEDGHG